MQKSKNLCQVHSLIFYICMTIIPIIHFVVFYIGINFNSILLAFEGENGLTLEYFRIFLKELGQSGTGATLREGVLNTVTIFVMSIVVVLPSSLIFSFLLYKKIWLHRFYRIVFFLPNIISAVVLVALYKNILNELVAPLLQKIFNLESLPLFFSSNQYAFKSVLLYMIWLGLASNMVIYSGAMARIPVEILEAGKIDGVGFFREFTCIVLPLMWPTVSVVLLLAIVGIFNTDGPILLMTQGRFGTYTLAYWIYDKTMTNNVNYGAAVGLAFTVLSIPIMLVSRFIFSKLDNDVEF